MSIYGKITSDDIIRGQISESDHVSIRGQISGSDHVSIPEIGIFNHGTSNFINGYGWYCTRHPGNTHHVVKDPTQIYTMNSDGDMYTYGYTNGHIRQAFVVPFVDQSKTKFKMIVSVQKCGTYNVFVFCVGEDIDVTEFEKGYYAESFNGIQNRSPQNRVTDYFHDKDISVTREEVEVTLNPITTGKAVIFIGQCDNNATIHEMWFE